MDVDLYQYKVINLGEFWFTVTAKRGIYTIPKIQFNSLQCKFNFSSNGNALKVSILLTLLKLEIN